MSSVKFKPSEKASLEYVLNPIGTKEAVLISSKCKCTTRLKCPIRAHWSAKQLKERRAKEAECKRKQRAQRTEEQIDTDRHKDKIRKREYRASRTEEKILEDRKIDCIYKKAARKRRVQELKSKETMSIENLISPK